MNEDIKVGDKVVPYGEKRRESTVLAVHAGWAWIKEDSLNERSFGYLANMDNLAKVQPRWEVGCRYIKSGDYVYEVLKVSPLGTAVITWTPRGDADLEATTLTAEHAKDYRKVS